MYKVKRPSETRQRSGPRRPAATPTTRRPRRANPGLGPVMGQFFGLGQTKPAPTKDPKEPAVKKK